MTREIKFRAWNGKEWVKPKDANVYSTTASAKTDKSPLVDRDTFDVHVERRGTVQSLTVCIFTGLKDKNGKEIYEGDILNTEAGKCEVNWYGDGACFRFKYGYNLESPLNYDEYEVIGNIYENSELLTPSHTESIYENI